jgi:hypothetical protein
MKFVPKFMKLSVERWTKARTDVVIPRQGKQNPAHEANVSSSSGVPTDETEQPPDETISKANITLHCGFEQITSRGLGSLGLTLRPKRPKYLVCEFLFICRHGLVVYSEMSIINVPGG